MRFGDSVSVLPSALSWDGIPFSTTTSVSYLDSGGKTVIGEINSVRVRSSQWETVGHSPLSPHRIAATNGRLGRNGAPLATPKTAPPPPSPAPFFLPPLFAAAPFVPHGHSADGVRALGERRAGAQKVPV